MLSAESSSRFGKEADEGVKLFGVRWGLFPAIQAGWLISSEDWFRAPWVNSLKLVAGYEESGNDDIDYYATRTYFQNVKVLNTATGLQLANIANPKIQWETNHRFNIGLNANLFNNRVTLGAEVYFNKITNLLTKKEVSYLTGLANMWTNEGAMRNNGVEVSLSGIIINYQRIHNLCLRRRQHPHGPQSGCRCVLRLQDRRCVRFRR